MKKELKLNHFMEILERSIQDEKNKGNSIHRVNFQIEFISGDSSSIKTISYSGEKRSYLS